MRTKAELVSIHALSPALWADLVADSRAATFVWRSWGACANREAGRNTSQRQRFSEWCLIVGQIANVAILRLNCAMGLEDVQNATFLWVGLKFSILRALWGMENAAGNGVAA